METVFPIVALSDQLQEVKEAAKNNLVRITEDGSPAWVFASEEAFEKHVNNAVADALYEARVGSAVARGMSDFEHDRYVVETDAVRAELSRMRQR